MPIIDLPPEQVHVFADTAEDEAYCLPPGPKRTEMLTMVYQMRARANYAMWLGDEIKAEMIEATSSSPSQK